MKVPATRTIAPERLAIEPTICPIAVVICCVIVVATSEEIILPKKLENKYGGKVSHISESSRNRTYDAGIFNPSLFHWAIDSYKAYLGFYSKVFRNDETSSGWYLEKRIKRTTSRQNINSHNVYSLPSKITFFCKSINLN